MREGGEIIDIQPPPQGVLNIGNRIGEGEPNFLCHISSGFPKQDAPDVIWIKPGHVFSLKLYNVGAQPETLLRREYPATSTDILAEEIVGKSALKTGERHPLLFC